MCGISGVINFKSKVNKKIVEKINNKILFRGPHHKKVIWVGLMEKRYLKKFI